MTSTDNYLVSLSDYFDIESWPLAALVPDDVSGLLMVPPSTDAATGAIELGFFVDRELALRFPGVDAFWLVVSPGAGGTLVHVDVRPEPFGVTLRVPLVLRFDTSVLCPVDDDDEPDRSAPTFDVTLGEVDVTVSADGTIELDLGPGTMPRCMVGSTGVILEIGTLQWITPATPATSGRPVAPAGFTGIYLDDVEVKVTQLPPGANALRLDDGFIGTGGFSGRVSVPDLGLDWDAANQRLTGTLTGELFGFQGGLSSVEIEFRQSALVGCAIGGDVFIPWVDALVGLELGLSGDGELTALVRTPHSPAASAASVTAGTGGHLIAIDVYGVLGIEVDAILFERPAQGPAAVEITGAIRVSIDGLDLPEIGLKALRIDTDGNVAIDGGWMEVPSGTVAPFHGFPLEISKVGFGNEGSGAAARMWVGLSGALKLADGLPVGGSVEGLRISWSPTDPLGTLAVTLTGVGIELDIPNVVRFSGSVSFFDDGTNQGFRGGGHLSLPSVGIAIDVGVVIGRNRTTGQTFFYFHLGVDLPVGIPLFQTGVAFYGFEGLVASNMGPDRRAGEPWYWGWYVRAPRGATDQAKWGVQPGAFAAGLGTTIGTLPDTGFTFNAKVLLVLVLPGPVLLLEGKGSFLRNRPSGSEEGIFEALLALDVPAKLFQTNLAVTYSIQHLVDLRGGADIGFSWASPPPPHFWHVYLGEDQPPERRWRANLLSIFKADAYFMIERTGIRLGARIGFDEDWRFGPVRVWAKAEISGAGEVSIKPQHLHGELHLGGEAGVSVFGAKIVLGVTADFAVDGPTPWHVEFDLQAYIEIDLWLFSFDWSTTIHLEWTESVPRQPQPARPVVERLAHQHLVVDAGGDLAGATLAPDARQVVVFGRPVQDLAGIGAPASPTLAADAVGPARFSYQLGQVALHRRRGSAWTVVAAAGFVDVTGGTVRAPGLTLDGAAGSRISLLGGSTYDVTGSSAGTLSVSGTMPGGRAAYRLRGARPQATVQVTAVTPLGAGLASVTLAADPGLARDVLGGGTLSAGGRTYAIAGNQGPSIVVRTSATAPTMPPVGAATAVGPEGPSLQAAWMPSDGAAGATKLLIGARTPFAQFHNNLAHDGEPITVDPDYVCGPEPHQHPTCVTFDRVPTGPVDAAPVPVGALQMTGSGEAAVVDVVGTRPARVLEIGSGVAGRKPYGTVTFTFPGPADQAWVRATTMEGAKVTASLGGAPVHDVVLRPGDREVELAGPLDAITIDGSLVVVTELCYLPDWTCVHFEAATFPHRSTGRQAYAGLTLETTGQMSVVDDVLVVTPPGRRVVPVLDLDDLVVVALPFVDLVDRFTVRPVGVVEPDLGVPVVPTVPGLDEPRDVLLPGIGPVLAKPPALDVKVRRRLPDEVRRAAERVTLRSDLERLVDPAPWHRPLLQFDDVAAVTVYFPRPVTRVRVQVAQAANVTIAAGPTLVATGVADPAAPLELSAGTGWVDRISFSARKTLEVREICTDAGEFGWERFEQWAWRESIRRSLSAFASEAPVLAPGSYRMDVVAGWVDEARAGTSTEWTTTAATFTVGAPPGLRSGETGPLNDLATYVDATMPAAGERPFYRSYDIGVAFSRDYVSRMYLENGTPLVLAVVDANEHAIRPGSPNVWGRGPDLALTREERDWLSTLHSDGTEPCASIDTASVSRNELVHAGAGELLLEAQLHTGILQTAAGRRLFSFDFVTSRYASFAHHVAHFAGARAAASAAPIDGAGPLTGLAAAELARTNARSTVATAAQGVAGGNPTATHFDALASARRGLTAAKEALAVARRDAFAALARASGISATRPRPAGVEVTVVDGCFLVESDEPLSWDRITLTARTSPAVPQQVERIEFDPLAFGTPDTGTFVYDGREWQTTAELWAKGGAVRSRLATPWTLVLRLDDATRVDVSVELEVGGTVTLHGDGRSASADAVAASAGAVTLSVTGDALTACSLTGSGFAARAVVVTVPWSARPAAGGVRVADVAVPTSASDTGHYVELMADVDVDLRGWRIEWRPADASAPWATYHLVPSVDRTVPAGGMARVYGGLATGTASPGRATWFGGTVGPLPPTGVVVRVLDAQGVVRHERAAMPPGSIVPCSVAADGDLTRAYLVPATRSSGWWSLSMTYARDLGLGEAVHSVAGITTPELATISFRAP